MRRMFIGLVALAASGCAKTVPLTSDLRASLAETSRMSDLKFRVIGTFELRSGGRSTVTVRNETPAFTGRADNDTTVTVQISAPQLAGPRDTLELTFSLSQSARGAYTLRAINGISIGRSISIGGAAYQYVPCPQNFGSQCLEPIPEGAREDTGVRLGVRR
jgi:hypothetical protein